MKVVLWNNYYRDKNMRIAIYIIRWIKKIALFFFLSTILTVIVYRFIPVYITPLMVIRCFQQATEGEFPTLHHTWVPLENITSNLPKAVVASEDSRFFTHSGFDTIEIEKAIKESKRKNKIRGASTISQQTAKNVFLWPNSSWVRKGFEVYFTLLIELVWNKERILEVYVNSIEMGKGIYGAEAVAKYHFNTTAKKLSRSQCALIAATLPNPIRFSSKKPSGYILRRKALIEKRMNYVVLEYLPKKTNK